MATFTLAALKSELQQDPKTLGYAALLAPTPNYQALVAKVNATYGAVGTVWRTDVGSSELLACLVWSELASFTAAQWSAALVMLSPATIDGNSPNVRAFFAGLFAGKNVTLANLTAAAQKASPSRAEELWGYGVRISEQNIADALSS